MDLDILVENICTELKLPEEVQGILYIDLIKALIMGGSIKEAAHLLDMSDTKLEHLLYRKVSKTINKPFKIKWNNYLLGILFVRECYKCKQIQAIENFGLDVNKAIGLSAVCNSCSSTRSKTYRDDNIDTCRARIRDHYKNNKSDYLASNAKRRAVKITATPKWANLDKIKEIYNNCPKNYHVDHIIPLKGVLVSGLHVENNLQYLTAEENLQKSNKYFIE